MLSDWRRRATLRGAVGSTEAVPAAALGVPPSHIEDFPYMQPSDSGLDRERVRRQAAERSLRESEQRLRRIFDHSNDAILVIDPAADRILEAKCAGGGDAGLCQRRADLGGDDLRRPPAGDAAAARVRRGCAVTRQRLDQRAELYVQGRTADPVGDLGIHRAARRTRLHRRRRARHHRAQGGGGGDRAPRSPRWASSRP